MQLRDPDTIVNWYRVEEPGENPRWESQCGIVEQVKFGDMPSYRGYLSSGITLAEKPTLALAKTQVELSYKKNNQLIWSYSETPITLSSQI